MVFIIVFYALHALLNIKRPSENDSSDGLRFQSNVSADDAARRFGEEVFKHCQFGLGFGTLQNIRFGLFKRDAAVINGFIHIFNGRNLLGGKTVAAHAFLFAFFGVMASFGIGSTVQANSVAQAVHSSFGIDTWITGVVLTLITAFVVLGGIQSIARVSSVVVPFMAVLYIVGGLVVVAMHFDLLLPALKVIMHDAFSGQAVAGGVVGTVIRYGVARGVFSNEAGMGSAPIAAAAAKTDHPVRQALVSMTGTFLDTIIVCSITGIVLVMGILQSNSGAFAVPDLKGAALTTATFDAMLSGYGGWVVTIGLIFFAYSTTLGWCYYGEKCATYVFGDKSVPMYRVIYVATVMLGTVLSMDMVWAAADTFNGLMAVPNLVALLLLSKVIVQETRDFKAKRANGELDY